MILKPRVSAGAVQWLVLAEEKRALAIQHVEESPASLCKRCREPQEAAASFSQPQPVSQSQPAPPNFSQHQPIPAPAPKRAKTGQQEATPVPFTDAELFGMLWISPISEEVCWAVCVLKWFRKFYDQFYHHGHISCLTHFVCFLGFQKDGE